MLNTKVNQTKYLKSDDYGVFQDPKQTKTCILVLSLKMDFFLGLFMIVNAKKMPKSLISSVLLFVPRTRLELARG